jgi:hypothetical protein
VHVATINRKSWYMDLCDVWGMRLSNTTGMLSGRGDLRLGRWWRASQNIAGNILSIIMCWVGVGPAGIAFSQEKGSCGLIF